MPCTTFSRARRHDGLGPGPLRDASHIWGLPDLSRGDYKKLQTGNALFLFTLRILRICDELHIPFIVENPESSMAWDVPVMREFISTTSSHECNLDFCMYGELWRKPTKLVYKFIDISMLARKCTSTNNKCCRTHRPHIALKGVSPCGKFWTLLAQPYPEQLTAAFARALAIALSG
eukprot:Skav221328  [mRNA]  locus=scaffold1437:51466:51993:- [translate_table: standard]